MAIALMELKGMEQGLADKLRGQGIADSDALLEAAKGPTERKGLAKSSGATEKAILALANRADLSRIKGVAGVFSDLLELAGVDTVKELATRRPDNLHTKLEELNQGETIAKRTPTLQMVQDWVAQAKELPTMLTY